MRVCIGPVCDCLGAKDLLAREQETANGVPVLGVECLGHCDLGPVLLRGDEVEPEVVYRTNDGPSTGLAQADETLADYEARGGFEVLRNLPRRERIVEELKSSGLTGYGGAGFPTGVKWEAVAREPGPRYVVVNADEGEPGTIKDRYVMERRPHLMLEGMLVAMRFAEATEGFIYLREEYATARARLTGRSRSSGRPASSTGSPSSSSSAPARTSAARRPRCSSRWRAGAGCRVSSRLSRARSAISAVRR